MNPLTYPARPVNGGPLEHAHPKAGEWRVEPKFNGWRALVHVPTGTMFNRHGKRLSIEQEFHTALDSLGELSAQVCSITWLDVECLERRHNVGRGSLIILDLPDEATKPYSMRRELLADLFDVAPDPAELQPNQVYLSPSYPSENAPALWTLLKTVNARVPDFYEGLVAKRADSTYPVQLHSTEYEFHAWMKHRWRF